jgi:hypothetical protein
MDHADNYQNIVTSSVATAYTTQLLNNSSMETKVIPREATGISHGFFTPKTGMVCLVFVQDKE